MKVTDKNNVSDKDDNVCNEKLSSVYIHDLFHFLMTFCRFKSVININSLT